MQTPTRTLDIEHLQQQLSTVLFGRGKRLVYLPSVDSTNTFAMKMAREGSEEGMVVLTDSQTAGKGRQGRHWVDVTGHNAISSTVLRPVFSPYLLVMIASLAVIDAIAETCGVVASIKWPNDILIGTSKVAGILIETSHDLAGRLVAVVGIGVNVNGHIPQLMSNESEATGTVHEELQSLITAATTLETECGHPVSRETFIAHLLRHFETSYLALQEKQGPGKQGSEREARRVRERWRSHLSTLERTVQVRQGDATLSGVAEDVNESGELLLRLHSGERVSITWGDVWHIPDSQ
ncbi:MAG: biotin--[acetyl-CoA-carboxylase] ligase [Chloroflexota bacterium]|nr:biotin--[acetyl-CoA-carboxylase] ligase [Chloroflexota bacterium]